MSAKILETTAARKPARPRSLFVLLSHKQAPTPRSWASDMEAPTWPHEADVDPPKGLIYQASQVDVRWGRRYWALLSIIGRRG